MHKRIIVTVSAVMFTLLAVAVALVADMHDRSYPEQLRAKAGVSLDFSLSEMSDEEAFRHLGALSDSLDLGLVKVAPDLSGDQSGQVFVAMGTPGRLPDKIERFGDEPDAQIKGPAALEHSYAGGEYLVTGTTSQVGAFKTWLRTHQVGNKWNEDNLGATMMLVLRQGSFATSMLAAVALMVSLVLYWLSVKAKGRAVRVLAGVSTWRIQYEDLCGFLTWILAAAIICDIGAVAYIALAHGGAFVPYYISTLLTFDAIVILTTMACAVAMSAASWPSVRMLAAREPAVKSLRKASVALKVATFTLVLVAVSPAVAAYTASKDTAAQQAKWKSLADQVALSFPAAMGESGFQGLMADVGAVVADAEERGALALSYTWTGDDVPGVDLGSQRHVSLVNQRWLDLMFKEGGGAGNQIGRPDAALVPVPLDQVPDGARRFLVQNMELWSRGGLTGDEVLTKLSFHRYEGTSGMPLSLAGGGDLVFPDDALVIVVPDVHQLFNDDFLASTTSSKNLLFTGVAPTQALLAQHGLQHKVQVKHVAEEGVLRAQLTAYFAWLQGVSLVALTVALAVAAFIGAFITAVLKARRDFPLRLAGRRWSEILADRVVTEWSVGAALAVLVILARGMQGSILVAAVALAGLLISPVTHLVAARWTFENVSLRRL